MNPIRLIALLSLLLATCSHDAKRENLLDPELTPAVTLAVAVDDTAGTVTLDWSRYKGDYPFAAYRVLRVAQYTGSVDSLFAEITHIDSTRLVDTRAIHGTVYEYRVSVINSTGFETAYATQTAGSVQLPAVGIVRLEPDSRSASATVTWTPYIGPRFGAYQVYRSEGSDTKLVHTFADADVVSFVDTDLLGNTAYSYRIDVVSEIGEQVPSSTASGGFHLKVSEWLLDLEPGAAFRTNVRLYALGGGRIAALTVFTGNQSGSSISVVRLLVYTSGGELLDGRTLLLSRWESLRDARTVSAALDSIGLLHMTVTSFLAGEDVSLIRLLRYPDPSVAPIELWRQAIAGTPDWASLALMGTDFALTANGQPYHLTTRVDTADVAERNALDGWVGETRVWQEEGQLRVGVCMPSEDLVKWGTVFRTDTWETSLRTVVGPHISGPAQTLFYPVSFDAGPDGRVYVLDAGSGRVLVFDSEGGFITQWGRRGTGFGEFDFGSGDVIVKGLDFAGSIAVDDDGFIYVADVGNQRIQKFAP